MGLLKWSGWWRDELQQHSLSRCKPNCWHNYPGRTGLPPRLLVALGKGEKLVPLISSRVIASHIQIDPEGNVWCSAEFLQGRDFSCPRQFGQKAYIYKAAQSIPSFLPQELKHFGWKLQICVPSGHQYSIFCPANLFKPSKCCLRLAASQETSQFKTLAPSANSKPVLITSMRPQGNQEVRLTVAEWKQRRGCLSLQGFKETCRSHWEVYVLL